ncbi:glycosyl transferase [Halorientalis sp. IM1011]|nr:glycosyl transferase [Halorientalis sp. IM1011]
MLNIVTNHDSQFFRTQVDRLRDRGVEADVLAVPGHNEANSVHGDGDRTRSVTDYLRFLPGVLQRSFGQYDLLHANYGLTAPAAVAQPNLPTVLSLWGSDLMGSAGWFVRPFAARVDEVVVMSDRMAAELDRDCHVVPHGVDLSLFQPEPQQRARDRLGWAHDPTIVLFPYPPSRDVKNYPRAERIVAATRDRVDGEVDLRIPSGVPHSEMPTYMNAADALLVTSKREGSPNTVKEALACNCPVVSTPVGDVPERLDGVRLSAVGGTDEELVEGLVAALEAGANSNGREAVRDLGLDATAERLHGVYERVLDGQS